MCVLSSPDGTTRAPRLAGSPTRSRSRPWRTGRGCACVLHRLGAHMRDRHGRRARCALCSPNTCAIASGASSGHSSRIVSNADSSRSFDGVFGTCTTSNGATSSLLAPCACRVVAPQRGASLAFAWPASRAPCRTARGRPGSPRRMSSLSRPDSCTASRVDDDRRVAWSVPPLPPSPRRTGRTVAEMPHTIGTAGTPLAPLISRVTIVSFSARSLAVVCLHASVGLVEDHVQRQLLVLDRVADACPRS